MINENGVLVHCPELCSTVKVCFCWTELNLLLLSDIRSIEELEYILSSQWKFKLCAVPLWQTNFC
jgi:hypothetical protein